jgi:hypothetical protein
MKQSVNDQSMEQVAIDLFGKNVNVSFNQNKTFACFTLSKKPNMDNPVNALDFGIFNVQKHTLVYREQKYNAHVNWFNNSYVVVKSRPGVKSLDPEQDKAMRVYYINVETLKVTANKPN